MDKEQNGRFAKGNKLGNRFDSNEATEQGRKGGTKSQEVQKERRIWREELSDVLMQKTYSLVSGECVTKNREVMERLVDRCLEGNVEAMKVAARILGEDTQKIEVQQEEPLVLAKVYEGDEF